MRHPVQFREAIGSTYGKLVCNIARYISARIWEVHFVDKSKAIIDKIRQKAWYNAYNIQREFSDNISHLLFNFHLGNGP